MDLHQESVSSDSQGSLACRTHQTASPGAVGRVYDYRKVRLLLQRRDCQNIQSVPSVGLEGTDAPLAQHDVFVSAQKHVLSRQEKLPKGGTHAPFQDEGLTCLAHFLQKLVVAHASGAESQHVRVVMEQLEMGQGEDLGFHKEMGLAPDGLQDGNSLGAQSPEGIGGGPGLEE